MTRNPPDKTGGAACNPHLQVAWAMKPKLEDITDLDKSRARLAPCQPRIENSFNKISKKLQDLNPILLVKAQ
jgi:hypothetical protein